jgi:hypothetical protein
MCVACTDTDSDERAPTCRSCHAPRARELEGQLERFNVKLGAGAVAQALLVPLLAWLARDEKLLVLTLWLAAPTFALGLLTAATRTLWILAPILALILAIIAVWAVGASAVMALGLLPALLLARWFFASGPVERELSRLRLGR